MLSQTSTVANALNLGLNRKIPNSYWFFLMTGALFIFLLFNSTPGYKKSIIILILNPSTNTGTLKGLITVNVSGNPF